MYIHLSLFQVKIKAKKALNLNDFGPSKTSISSSARVCLTSALTRCNEPNENCIETGVFSHENVKLEQSDILNSILASENIHS